MQRWIAVIATLSASWLLVLTMSPSTAAQDATTCASSVWLAPAAATPAVETAGAASGETPAWMTIELTDACSGETVHPGRLRGQDDLCRVDGDLVRGVLRAADPRPGRGGPDPGPRSEATSCWWPSAARSVCRVRISHVTRQKTGFPMIFAVMPEPMLKAMVDDLGRESPCRRRCRI